MCPCCFKSIASIITCHANCYAVSRVIAEQKEMTAPQMRILAWQIINIWCLICVSTFVYLLKLILRHTSVSIHIVFISRSVAVESIRASLNYYCLTVCLKQFKNIVMWFELFFCSFHSHWLHDQVSIASVSVVSRGVVMLFFSSLFTLVVFNLS